MQKYTVPPLTIARVMIRNMHTAQASGGAAYAVQSVTDARDHAHDYHPAPVVNRLFGIAQRISERYPAQPWTDDDDDGAIYYELERRGFDDELATEDY